MGIYSVVDDPDNAPLAIMGIILAPLSLTSIPKVSQAAAIRRGMDDLAVLKLGAKLGGRMGTIKKVTGSCRRTG